jgi:hypothetical protein
MGCRMLETFTKEDAIEYLVNVKYPKALLYQGDIHTYIPTGRETVPYKMPDAELQRRLQGKELYQKAEEYRAELNAMNYTDVGLFYNEVSAEERRKEEEQKKVEQEAKLKYKLEEDKKFYSYPHMIADLNYWSKMATWDMESFTALAFGKEPKFINWDYLKRIQGSPFVIQYSRLRDLVYNSASTNALFHQDKPINFINWAIRNEIDLPEGLAELVKKYSTQPNWEVEYKKLHKEFNKFKEEAKLSSVTNVKSTKHESQTKRKLNNTLKLLYCIAYEDYGYRNGIKSSTPADLAGYTALHKVKISDDVVRSYLEEGADLVGEDTSE